MFLVFFWNRPGPTLERHWGVKADPKGARGTKMEPKSSLWDPPGVTFSVKIRDSGTLLEQLYLLCFYNKNKVWGRTECVWN